MYPLKGLFFAGLFIMPLQSLVAQTCQTDYPETTPTERFEINNNSVYDKKTNLTWKRCLQGVSGAECNQGQALQLNWEQALQAAENEAGWRLSNIKELMSIVERQCVNPALNSQVFPGSTSSDVWSSSPDARYTHLAWDVTFGNGYSNYTNRNRSLQVRLVRSGQ